LASYFLIADKPELESKEAGNFQPALDGDLLTLLQDTASGPSPSLRQVFREIQDRD
jgi:hypothetical protein